MQLVRPLQFTEAVEKIGRKTPIGSDLSSSEWRDVPVALREKAFFSSRVESVRFLQRARDSIADFLAANRETLDDGQAALKTGSRADFVKQMQDFLEGEGVVRTTGDIKDITSEKRLSLIIQTQARQAHDFGNWKQGMDPDVLNEFPAQRFIRVLPVKEGRTEHQQWEGQARLKTDLAFWTALNQDFGVPWGPWGWGCGHDVEDVDRDEAEELGLIQPGQVLEPAERDLNDRLQASTRGLDPDLIQKLIDSFGDQIKIEGDKIEWAGPRSRAAAPEQPEPAPVMGRPTLESVLDSVGLGGDEPATAESIGRLIEELKEDHPLDQSQVIAEVSAPTRGMNSESAIRADVQEFLKFLPPEIVRGLPKLRITALAGDRTYMGQYSGAGSVELAKVHLKDTDRRRRTMFHELMHWVHMEGAAGYKKAIKDHFDERTRGESVVSLPGYRDAVGKLDRWYDAYAGRIYRGKDGDTGLEIPTRYIEWLTMSREEQVTRWNDPDFRETMKIVLKGLFP